MLRQRLLALALLLPGLLVPLGAPAQGPAASLVRDVNTRSFGWSFSSYPDAFTSLGGKLYFTAQIGDATGLWVSDGSASGTRQLTYSSSEVVGSAGNTLFFRNEDRLWRSDGTRAGTFALAVPVGDPVRPLGPFLSFGGVLYFTGCVDYAECQLWRTDGTAAGTRRVKEIGDWNWEGPTELVELGGRIYLLTPGGETDHELWVSDGTESGTTLVKAFEEDASSLAVAGGRLFLFADDGAGEELWVSDGTPAGTRAITSFVPPTPLLDRPWLKASGGRVYFLADDVVHGNELWRSDGTPQGTVRVTDFGFHNPLFGTPESYQEIGGRLFFFATDGLHGVEIWTTNGDPASTSRLPSACPAGTCRIAANELFRVGDRLLFEIGGTDQSERWSELWSTDGTAAGTFKLARLCGRECTTENLRDATVMNGLLYFARRPDDESRELWRTDGTVAGTKRFAASIEADLPVAAVGRDLFFRGQSREHGWELWASDGRPGGERLVMDIARDTPGSYPRALRPMGERLYFNACDGVQEEVWQTSGTSESTVPVPGAAPGDPHARCDRFPIPGPVTVVGSSAYFLRGHDTGAVLWKSDGDGAAALSGFPSNHAADLLVSYKSQLYLSVRNYDADVVEVWKSDGTAQGTVRAFSLPAEVTEVRLMTAVGDDLYVVARADGDYHVWRSDGTQAGTRQVTDYPYGLSHDSDPRFTRLGRHVYFLGYDNGPSINVWRTEGTAASTTGIFGPDKPFYFNPKELTAHAGALYFFARSDFGTIPGLWRSDGTAAGSAALYEFVEDSQPGHLTVVGPRLFFVAADEAHGTELWVSDGTAAGTRLVRDIHPGPDSSGITDLFAAGGRLFFVADDGVHGAELWQSDGTEAGTRLVQDIAPGLASSGPRELTATASRLFFSADDGITGRELWSLPLGQAGCVPSATQLCLNGGRFRVEALWRDFAGNQGTGTAVPLTPETGYFWFFDPANVETIVKVLDGRGLNDHHWVFYGALSNVEYILTVTDTWTGAATRYFNPLGQFASVGDTAGFGRLGATVTKSTAAATTPRVTQRIDLAASGACAPAAGRLCLNGGRFAVEARWKDFAGQTGQGTAVGLTGDTGYFWFFGPDNVEVVLKVLDGQALNGKFWVFFGALSNVEYTLTVTDTQTGKVKTYTNPGGRFASVGDTNAF